MVRIYLKPTVTEVFYSAIFLKKFPENPRNLHPVQLFNEMKPDIRFTQAVIIRNMPLLFQVECVIDNILFTGQGSSKKGAKKECCIAAIKHFWKFDYHAI